MTRFVLAHAVSQPHLRGTGRKPTTDTWPARSSQLNATTRENFGEAGR
jgi:hypothetical protein